MKKNERKKKVKNCLAVIIIITVVIAFVFLSTFFSLLSFRKDLIKIMRTGRSRGKKKKRSKKIQISYSHLLAIIISHGYFIQFWYLVTIYIFQHEISTRENVVSRRFFCCCRLVKGKGFLPAIMFICKVIRINFWQGKYICMLYKFFFHAYFLEKEKMD